MKSFLKRGVKLTSSGKDDRQDYETRIRDGLSIGFHSRGHCSLPRQADCSAWICAHIGRACLAPEGTEFGTL